MAIMTVPQGVFQLTRFPFRKKDTLRAWDAADEYLLDQLDTENLPVENASVLILNDLFGALSVALSKYQPHLVSDSYLTHQGTLENFKSNSLPVEPLQLFNSLNSPGKIFDLILIKIPRSMALLEYQLHSLRASFHADTRIMAAGMSKAIHTSTLQLFERTVGPTRTSLARKKARLIFCQPDMALKLGCCPYPSHFTLEETGQQITNHANVFSREKLDNGTRFLLEHMPHTALSETILDLGCGNGVLGLIAAGRNPKANLIFTDESYMAIASAEANFKTAFGDQREARFTATDVIDSVPAGSIDLVLNNPPFHQERGQGDTIARDMFRAAKQGLRQGGTLWVVGNRHLAYHITLEQLFGNCRTVASNSKFVILKAIKR